MNKLTTGPLKAKSALLVVALAVTTGVLIDRLVIDQRTGLGFALATLFFVWAVWKVSARRRPEALALLGGAALLFAWSLVRSAEYLIAIDTLAALALVSLAVTAATFDPRVWLHPLVDHIRSAVDQGIAVVVGAVRPLGTLARSRTSMDVGPAMPYLRGVLFAIPVFGLFALLLSSADSVFSGVLGDLIPNIDLSLGGAGQHIFIVGLFAWLVAGYLAFAWEPPHATTPASAATPTERRHDRFVEVMVVLSSVAALFALFVAIQFAYLFRGNQEIVSGTMTYAEYARQGFFQLLAVSALTAALVWISMLWLRPLTGRRRAIFRTVCTVMVLLTGVILASALKRLGLYEEAYGYTRLRVLSHAFTFLVGGVLVLIAAQVFLERDGLIPAGAVALGFVVLFGLNLVNPDGYIAERNLDRAIALEQRGDIAYVTELSEDAVPAVFDRLPALSPFQQNQLRRWAEEAVGEPRDWREWNLGASRAAAETD